MGHMLYYLTKELDHAKRDSRLAAYGGVLLQRLEGLNLKRFVWKRNGFAGKANSAYILWIKSTYPVVVFYFLMFASSWGRSNAISASYRSVGFHC